MYRFLRQNERNANRRNQSKKLENSTKKYICLKIPLPLTKVFIQYMTFLNILLIDIFLMSSFDFICFVI